MGDTAKQMVEVDKVGGKNQNIPIPIPDNPSMDLTFANHHREGMQYIVLRCHSSRREVYVRSCMTSRHRLHTGSSSRKRGGAHLNPCGNGLTCFLNSWEQFLLFSHDPLAYSWSRG